jgi:hypothetical protein
MNKEFIPYEQALELKELGFDKKCFAAMDMYSNIDYGSEMYDWIKNGETVQSTWAALPLYQQAFRWFREKYNITSEISISANHRNDAKKWMHSVTNLEVMLYTNSDTTFETYEEAELGCLKKLIEIVKNK